MAALSRTVERSGAGHQAVPMGTALRCVAGGRAVAAGPHLALQGAVIVAELSRPGDGFGVGRQARPWGRRCAVCQPGAVVGLAVAPGLRLARRGAVVVAALSRPLERPGAGHQAVPMVPAQRCEPAGPLATCRRHLAGAWRFWAWCA